MMLLLTALLPLVIVPWSVEGHGRLMDPPARNSMWRLGFPNPVNYNDNELYCGGRVTQWARNKGKCGVCGDPHHHPNRDHEAGGKYANGIISRQYTQGDVIDVTVHITANHKGFFEFRICPVTDPKTEVTQECLDRHVMEMTNGESTRYSLPEGKSNQFFNVSLRLPADMTCQQCVIQWKYRTGNTWDKDESGNFCVGCGPQEEFYNCADVTIHPKDSQRKEGQATHSSTEMEDKSTKSESLQKNRGIVFTDYGQKKIGFVKKNQPNQNLNMDEKEKINLRNRGDISFSKLFRKGDDFKSQTESNLRFGFLNDGFNSYNLASQTVLPSQPSGVAYRWKASMSGNSDVEKIHNRFGYSSSSKKRENNHRHDNEHGNDLTSSKLLSTSLKPSDGNTVKHYRNYNSFQTILNNKQNEEFEPQALQNNYPERNSMRTSISSGKTYDKSTMKAHTSLKNAMSKVGINSQQRDNFLRRWKLLRLRQILARKALNATKSARTAKTKQKFLLHTKQPLTRSSEQLYSSKQPKSTKRQMATFTSALQRPEETNDNFQMQTSGYSPVYTTSFSETNSDKTAVEINRQSYLKKKLPSWLVKALKLKHKGHNTNDNNSHNSNNEITSPTEDSKNNHQSDQDDANHQMIVPVISKTNPPSTDKTIPDIRPKQSQKLKPEDDTEGNTATKTLKNIQLKYNSKSESSYLSNEESNKLTKMRTESGGSEDTESLVRYIVTLLLSRKIGETPMESLNQFDSNRDDNAENTNKISFSKINTTAGYSWFVPSNTETQSPLGPNSVHGGKVFMERQVNHEGILQNANVHPSNVGSGAEPSKENMENQSPSVRVEALPFNGLILGSAYGYGQGRVKGDLVQNYESQRTFQKEAINAQGRNSLMRGSSKRNIVSHESSHHQQQPQFSNYVRAIHQVQIREQAPKRRWVTSKSDGLLRKPNDHDQQWSAGTQNRQDYYSNQKVAVKAQLVCESLVTLGGGMDRWCTDNCNANFCPPSMCVCNSVLPTYSVYASRRNPAPSQQSPLLWEHQNAAVMHERTPTSINSGYIPETPRFIPHEFTLGINERHNIYPQANSKRTYYKPYYIAQAPYSSPVDTSSSTNNNNNQERDITPYQSINMASSDINQYQDSTKTIQPKNMLENIDRSTNTASFYPQKLNEQSPGYISEVATGEGQGLIHNPLKNYQSKGTHFKSSPYTESRINNQYRSNLDNPPQQFNWLPNTRTGGDILSSNSREGDSPVNAPKPYMNYIDQRPSSKNQLPPAQVFAPNINYNAQDQSYVGHTQSYPQLLDIKRQSVGKSVQQSLRCKAIGAYAGLKHFDQWCDSTCYNTMCPLLICSCES